MDTKKSGNDISLSRLKLYHAVTGFLLKPFQDQNKFYDIWVHGLGCTKVYFQIGMVVGDIEEHNKICGFHGDNGLYRQHFCRDCSVCTEDADNPDIECELREVGDACKFLKQYLDKETYPDGKLPNMFWCDSD